MENYFGVAGGGGFVDRLFGQLGEVRVGTFGAVPGGGVYFLARWVLEPLEPYLGEGCFF